MRLLLLVNPRTKLFRHAIRERNIVTTTSAFVVVVVNDDIIAICYWYNSKIHETLLVLVSDDNY